jgi:rhamnosyltransferase
MQQAVDVMHSAYPNAFPPGPMNVAGDVSARVFAVVVTFHPELETLSNLLDRLRPQVAGIVVADNGSDGVVEALLASRDFGAVTRIDLRENIGVAAAINRGVESALKTGATHLLLSDQDSSPPPNMVGILMAVSDELRAKGMQVAAVGPRYVDHRAGHSTSFVRTQGLWLRSVKSGPDDSVVDVDFLITSGSLISATSWLAIGGMEERLFIDYVDIEWGLRARSKGYCSFGTFLCEMGHTLGDGRMKIFGLAVPLHSPLRHYYQIRNPVWMYGQPWIPLNWKVVDVVRLALRFAFYSLMTPPRFENITYMMRGFVDGVRGRLGRFDA